MATDTTPNDARIRGRADLQDYLDQFNGKNYERQIAYYAPDVLYKVGSLTLTSPRQIADFYAEFHQYSREFVRIGEFAMGGDTVAVTMPSRFEPFRDYEKNGLSFKAGSVIEIVSFIFYKLKDGKIHRIRVARYNGKAEDFES
ncbi:MAG TPA: nuclear transport factor 2 family protein [Sphingomonadaceae bacterium]|nr:nuclear transport factor 2 family protein [Sphingomonadaceae bacterium]